MFNHATTDSHTISKQIAMKNYTLILFIIGIFSCNAQNVTSFSYDNFENQLLLYQPEQNSKISKKDFDFANMILRETKSATNNKSDNFNLGDYFNILEAFVTLKESKKNINIAFEKFINADDSCEYVIAFEKSIKKNPKYDIIREDYLNKLKECISEPIVEKKFDIEKYCEFNNLDIDVVKQITVIKNNDEKNRLISSKKLASEQKVLDKKNQKLIDSLYQKHQIYLGKSLVGEKFETVMWAVIQHSNIEMMAKYLPIIQKAVKEKELDVVPFKMLIDRFYGLKYGYQIFGSQSGFGFELADDKKRKEIELKYGIE